MLDHGGDIDRAVRRFGGCRSDWLDLSTGINRKPFPVPRLDAACWTALPAQSDIAALCDAARKAYGTTAPVVALAGAQMAIQFVPHLSSGGNARVLSPTYNEHAATLRAAGWHVDEVSDLDALAGADVAVVVNPNNPDGRRHPPERLLSLLPRVGRLVVDESFVDAEPDLSLAAHAGTPGLLVLRSFGKFYGLAGVRLGFALGSEDDARHLASLSGPWPVFGPAIAIGIAALSDRTWQATTTARLAADAIRLDKLAGNIGWRLVGGTHLFRFCETGDAVLAQERLAQSRIWSRVFPWSAKFLRLGLPGDEREWERLSRALQA
jgi:cobalamin biosynthetic protein CobC